MTNLVSKAKAITDYLEYIYTEEEIGALTSPFNDVLLAMMMTDVAERYESPRMAALVIIGILHEANRLLYRSDVKH